MHGHADKPTAGRLSTDTSMTNNYMIGQTPYSIMPQRSNRFHTARVRVVVFYSPFDFMNNPISEKMIPSLTHDVNVEGHEASSVIEGQQKATAVLLARG